MTQPLSPAAQAIWEAYERADCDPYQIDPRQAGLAAALRALADQVTPEHRKHHPNTLDEKYRKISVFDVRNSILSIASELHNV